MRPLILISLLILSVSCGQELERGPRGKAGIQGTAGNNGTNGNDGSQGEAGQNGSNGSNGTNGHNSLSSVLNTASSCVNGGITLLIGTDSNDNSTLDISEVSSSSAICNGTNGAQGIAGEAGEDGQNGEQGQAGTNGQNGTNGTNGTNGLNGSSSPFTPVAILNPCGDAPNLFDEIFIQLSNGTIIASFSENSNGKNTRFSVIWQAGQGNSPQYMTTDGDNCSFSIDSSGTIVNENHHN